MRASLAGVSAPAPGSHSRANVAKTTTAVAWTTRSRGKLLSRLSMRRILLLRRLVMLGSPRRRSRCPPEMPAGTLDLKPLRSGVVWHPTTCDSGLDESDDERCGSGAAQAILAANYRPKVLRGSLWALLVHALDHACWGRRSPPPALPTDHRRREPSARRRLWKRSSVGRVPGRVEQPGGSSGDVRSASRRGTSRLTQPISVSPIDCHLRVGHLRDAEPSV